MLVDRSDAVQTYIIKHPVTGEDMPIRIAFIHGQPIVMIQDSKHGAKTFRNNTCTGARALVVGNYIIFFWQLHNIAFSPDSPLYHRDVEKLDRQDDNAATRLYASATLHHIITHFPEYVGLIVYLFVFGELVDAYQNRSISHSERVKMVLRAKFFLELWRLFLRKAGYQESRYCISREAIDICGYLVDGFIALLIVHRDHMGDEHTYPFLPWLHSTEVCEHVFGECRKLIKDFTHLDFLYMMPRLSILIRAACRFAHTSNPRDRASGYAHTYFDAGNVDLALLAVFPSDLEIATAAQEAWDEAANLWDLLGINPHDLLPASTQASSPETPAIVLPGIASWFAPGDDPVYDYDDEFGDNGSDSDSDDDPSESVLLQMIIDSEETAPSRSRETEERMLGLTCAAVALTLDDLTRV